MMSKRIFFTVTNDLTFDQRMRRICGSLASNGYEVKLIGRKLAHSIPLERERFEQKRLRCWFNKGKLFYAEYNLRLFFYLLFQKMDAICAIDLDTILPCLYISKLRGKKRIYDAHELFTGLKEVVSRPAVYKTWMRIERRSVPQFKLGYTVSDGIAEEFRKRYHVEYKTIRNLPVTRELNRQVPGEKYILYQGAVNEARAFEWVIPAMKDIHSKLVICGDGNFMEELKELIRRNAVEDKIVLKGHLLPSELWKIAQSAYMGIAIAENNGLNQYLALPNKFFDYIQAGLPQVTMDFPEYKKINDKYNVALLIPTPDPALIATTVNKLLDDTVLYQQLQQNCYIARNELNWEKEESKLLEFYKSVF